MAKTVFDRILDKTTGPKSYDWYRIQVRDMTTTGAKCLVSNPSPFISLYNFGTSTTILESNLVVHPSDETLCSTFTINQ